MNFRRLFMVLVVMQSAVASEQSMAQDTSIPEISVEFAGLIEFGCSEFSGSPVDEGAIDKLEQRLDLSIARCGQNVCHVTRD